MDNSFFNNPIKPIPIQEFAVPKFKIPDIKIPNLMHQYRHSSSYESCPYGYIQLPDGKGLLKIN